MSVNFEVQANGQPVQLTPNQVMFQANSALQGTGKAINAITPDGLTATVSQNGQSFDVPVASLLQAAGMQVSNVLPAQGSVDYDMVNPQWRYAISNLEDDGQKQFYLKQKLSEAGMPNSEIIGQGRDFFAYDPASGKYRALTNSPDWDLADLAEAGTQAGRIAPAIAGGILGTAAGPWGTAGGAVAGSAAGAAATRGLAAMDPAYQEAFEWTPALQSGAIDATISGVAPGVGRLAGQLGTKVLGRGAASLASQPVGSTLRSAGTVTSGTGQVLRAAELGGTQTGKFIGAASTPGLAEANLLGWLGQAPGFLARGGAKAAQWGAKKVAPQSRLAQSAPIQSAEEALAGLGSRLGAGGRVSVRPVQTGPMQPATGGAQAMESLGRAGRGMQYGQTLGRGLESLERGAGALQKGTEEVFGGIARGAAAVGRGMQPIGRGLQRAGTQLGRAEPGIWQQVGGRAVTGRIPQASTPLQPGMPMPPPVQPFGMPNPWGGQQQARPIPVNYIPQPVRAMYPEI